MNCSRLRQLLLLGLVCLTRGVSAQETPIEGPVVPEPEPTPAVEATPAPRLPMKAGDIMIEGRIEAISFANKQFTLSVTSFTLPDGKGQVFAAPKFKTVTFDDKTGMFTAPYPLPVAEGEEAPTPKAVSAWMLWPCRVVSVVGSNAGTGKPMAASLIEVGEQDGSFESAFPYTLAETQWFGGVRDYVADTGLRIARRFEVPSVGGRSPRPSNPNSDHPRGVALDFMVNRNSKLGDLLATYFQASAGMENVKYVIWKDTLVYPGSRTDWASLPVDYGPGATARHMDHVHVSFLESPRTPGPWLTPETVSGYKLASRGKRR